MTLRGYGRRRNSFLLIRCLKFAALIFVTWTVIDALYLRSALVRSAAPDPPPFRSTEKIFITSILWTNQITIQEHWIPALVELAKEIGPENVFVSIEESGSLDDTKAALRWLDYLLEEAGISRRIVLDEETHLDVISEPPGDEGWIEAPHGEWEVRRIPYLAKQRNKALQPLYDLEEKGGLQFDRILFLNDVVFHNGDVRRLLDTNGREFAAACSLDFKTAGQVYDTFALRDSDGYEPIMLGWPFFRAEKSRNALLKGLPVPVESCWNGIVAMDAKPFYDRASPLVFRGISDDLAKHFLEGSECCLIHADNPLSRHKGVWVNPNVRVGYGAPAYEAMNTGSSSWVSTFQLVYGPWVNWILRRHSSNAKEQLVSDKLTTWGKKSPENVEAGPNCLIHEMQILLWNGWAHI